jgi:hypothetical protein
VQNDIFCTFLPFYDASAEYIVLVCTPPPHSRGTVFRGRPIEGSSIEEGLLKGTFKEDSPIKGSPMEEGLLESSPMKDNPIEESLLEIILIEESPVENSSIEEGLLEGNQIERGLLKFDSQRVARIV